MLPCYAIDLPSSPDYFVGIGSSWIALFESKYIELYTIDECARVVEQCFKKGCSSKGGFPTHPEFPHPPISPNLNCVGLLLVRYVEVSVCG